MLLRASHSIVRGEGALSAPAADLGKTRPARANHQHAPPQPQHETLGLEATFHQPGGLGQLNLGT